MGRSLGPVCGPTILKRTVKNSQKTGVATGLTRPQMRRPKEVSHNELFEKKTLLVGRQIKNVYPLFLVFRDSSPMGCQAKVSSACDFSRTVLIL